MIRALAESGKSEVIDCKEDFERKFNLAKISGQKFVEVKIWG